MQYVLFAIHLIISFLICVVVLLQRSKGNGLAGAFGGVGAGEAMFGTAGVTTFLHKATIYLAIGFMMTSLGLAYLTASRSDAVARAAAGGEIVLPVGSTPVVPEEGASTATLPGDTTTGAAGAVGDDIVPSIGEDAAAADSAGAATGGDGIVPEENTSGGGNR